MIELDKDNYWFVTNPDRQVHIREPRKEPAVDKQRAVRYLDEQELAFRSLPQHDPKLRRIILYRVPPENPMYDANAPQILKIPFVLLPDEVIEDTDERLVPLIHELMVQEAMEAPSDGAIYAAVSARDAAEEQEEIKAEIDRLVRKELK